MPPIEKGQEQENQYPTLAEYLAKKFPQELKQLKTRSVRNISYADLAPVIQYQKDVWSDREFTPYTNFAELQEDLRETFKQYYDSTTNTWNFYDAKAHELVAAYLIERGYIIGLEQQVPIDAHILGALSDLLNMLYSRRQLPDPK